MALKKCKECGHEVAASAPTCPNCGVKDPAKRGVQVGAGAGCLIIIVFFVIFAMVIGDSGTSGSRTARQPSVPGAIERWTWNAVNIRQGRGISASVARTVQPGTTLLVKDLQDGWWVAYDAAGRQLGYVANSVLRSEKLPDKIATYTMAQQFVKDRLRAPRTAKFPWGSGDHHVEHLGNARFRVVSHVDAQNAFGALIRNNYVAVLQYVGNDRWRLEDLQLFQ